MIQRTRRHPFRAIFFGLLFGLGLGLMAIIYGWYFLGNLTPWIMVAIGILVGILFMFVPRFWRRSSGPPPIMTS